MIQTYSRLSHTSHIEMCFCQFAAANRIQINFCAIPDNTEGGMQEDLADFAASILDADHATLTCCSNGRATPTEVSEIASLALSLAHVLSM